MLHLSSIFLVKLGKSVWNLLIVLNKNVFIGELGQNVLQVWWLLFEVMIYMIYMIYIIYMIYMLYMIYMIYYGSLVFVCLVSCQFSVQQFVTFLVRLTGSIQSGVYALWFTFSKYFLVVFEWLLVTNYLSLKLLPLDRMLYFSIATNRGLKTFLGMGIKLLLSSAKFFVCDN